MHSSTAPARREGFWPVWIGALIAIAISIGVGAVLFAIGAELEGQAEAVFEGTAMLVAAGLLTWMIFWMRRQARTMRKHLEDQVEHALATGSALALAAVAFVGVLREGVETAVLLFGTVEAPTRSSRVSARSSASPRRCCSATASTRARRGSICGAAPP